MRFRLALLILTGATYSASVHAQTPPATTRTVIAATKLPTVTDKPYNFRAVSMVVLPGAQQAVSAVDGILYQLSGSTEVSIGAENTMLSPGSGMYIAGGKMASLRAAGGEPSTTIHFQLAAVVGGNQPIEAASANVKELYRNTQPISGLKAGSYDLNMTRVTFPPQMPSNPPHHRSGAALYYIISGTGANTINGKTEMKGPGSVIYEPGGLVHQWGNPGSTPLTFLSFNINPEGAPAVVADPPLTSQ
jgi:mannose-6-phosphate isomerase-like protein (cupin superfamily)